MKCLNYKNVHFLINIKIIKYQIHLEYITQNNFNKDHSKQKKLKFHSEIYCHIKFGRHCAIQSYIK